MSYRTRKQMAAGQRRSLQAMVNKLRSMACEWDDVDEFNITALDGLVREVEKVAKELAADE